MSVEKYIRYKLLARLCPNRTEAEIRSVCTDAGMLVIRARRKGLKSQCWFRFRVLSNLLISDLLKKTFNKMLTRAGGLLALLQDNPTVKQGSSSDQEIKVQHVQFGLRKLDMVVEEFWAEISDSIQTIEVSSILYKAGFETCCLGGV